MTTTASRTTVNGAHLRRVAGAGALTGAVFYLLQPLAVFILVPEATKKGFRPSPATLAGAEWQGPYELATFGGIAVGTVLLVVALAVLQGRRATVLDWVGTAFGLAGATGWIAVAGLSLAQHSLVAVSLGNIGANLVTQQAGFQTVAIVLTGLIGLAAFGGAGWGIASGIAILRRRRELGRTTGIVALVGGLGVMAAALVSLHPIAGALMLIPTYLVLGIVLLISSRHAVGVDDR